MLAAEVEAPIRCRTEELPLERRPGENAVTGLSLASKSFQERNAGGQDGRRLAIGDQWSVGSQGSISTIGHSNHSVEKFAGLLKRHGIEVLVDTRSHPYSRHTPHFNTR